jgi:hypothetical protein
MDSANWDMLPALRQLTPDSKVRINEGVTNFTFAWPCIVTCDRASWHVIVHRDMWSCIVTFMWSCIVTWPCIVTCDRASWRPCDLESWRDRASWHVIVHRDMWPCIVTCGRESWHVTVHRDMWPCIVTKFLVIKPTRRTNFSNLFWKWKSTCFGQFLRPSSGVIRCTPSNGICHTGL